MLQTWGAKARTRHGFESESSESRESAAGGGSVGGRVRGDANMPLRASISTVAFCRANPLHRGREIEQNLPSTLLCVMDAVCRVIGSRDVSDMPWGCQQFCVAAVSQKLLPYNSLAF